MPPLDVLRTFVSLIRLDMLDLNGAHRRACFIATVPIVAVIGYALYAMRRSSAQVSRLFVWCTLACTALPFVLLDLMSGGQRTTATRYFIPLFLAIDLSLAALISVKVLSAQSRMAEKRLWLIAFSLIFGVRIASCAMSAQAQTWWTKFNMRSIDVAAALNSASHPLLISNDYIVWALALGEYADPSIDVALNPRCYLCAAPNVGRVDLTILSRQPSIDTVFLFGLSEPLQREVKGVMAARPQALTYRCIDIRDNCRNDLSLFPPAGS
jgi:uncharacterized membrane protein YsdA (DUF1294 family)